MNEARGHLQGISVWPMVFGISAVMAILVFFQLDVSSFVQAAFLGLLIMGLVTFLLYLCGDGLRDILNRFLRKKYQEKQGSGLSPEEISRRQRDAREKIQKDYDQKTARYEAEVLRPRQDAKKAELEKEFFKFAGPAWKGKSQRLGDSSADFENSATGSETDSNRKQFRGTSKDAATHRKLPESVTRPNHATVKEPQTKKVITLPDEPKSNEQGCITVAVRGLQNTVNKRRFLLTEKVQVLFDWMTKQGYHPKLYTVCTTYPRMDLSQHIDKTLQDAQLVQDVMLVIEERD